MRARSSSSVPGDLSPASDDLALVGRVEPGDEVEQRRLAAARRAHDGDELARRASSRSAPRSARTGAPSASKVLRRPRHVEHGTSVVGHRLGAPGSRWSPSEARSRCTVICRRRPGSRRPLTSCGLEALGHGRRPACAAPLGRVAEHDRPGRAAPAPAGAGPGSRCRRRPCTRAAPPSRAARRPPRRSTGRCRARTAGRPSPAQRSLTASWRVVHGHARPPAARSAWSSCGTGAPNTAITASPTNCITVPPSPRIARFISARCVVELAGQRGWGRSCSAMRRVAPDVGHQHGDLEPPRSRRCRRPSRRSFSARPPGSRRLSVSPCSSRSTMAWCSMRSRRSAPAVAGATRPGRA